MLERHKLGDVQALVAQSPVERFDQSILDRLAGPDKVELNAVAPRPLVQEPRGELAAVVDSDRPGQGASLRQPLQSFGHLLAGERETGLQHQTLATPLIDDGKDTKS